MRRKSVFLSACLLLVTLIASAQIGQRGVHIIGSTNISYTGQPGSGVSVFNGSGSGSGGSIPANSLLNEDSTPLLNEDAIYLLNEN